MRRHAGEDTGFGRAETPLPSCGCTPSAGALCRGCCGPDRSTDGYWATVNRQAVLEVPGDARHVLDVGCGGGGTGAALKRRQQVEVCGIEVDQAAAARAERVLDTVVCGDVEEVSLAFPPGYFDCIIYGDILEHLRWPGDVLQVHRRVLADDGRVIVTIPNVQYFGVSLRVLLGRWQYAPMGIMDLTHLRFFTRRGAIAMLSAQGYKVVRLRPDYGPRRWLRVVDALTLGLVRGLLAYKYVIVAIPAAGMSCSG